MKKNISLLLLTIFFALSSYSKEGMWLPMLLKSLNESDMQSMGLKLSAEDIYSINQSSLKDAVISFGGFCTGEIISDQGLILTNHHCGYGKIQSHSSVENDYLTNGYWAMNNEEELKNPGLTATFIVRMEDVTEQVLSGVDNALSESDRQKEINNRMDSIVKVATDGSHYDGYIRPFFYGNEYYMFITETFKDVRLVGAPPSSIGKFGGDTDNWMWPRHTGDFSLFRIYADKDNKPADYSEANVPYQPKHYFPISTAGIQEGDFTMVFGFPGRTQEYLTSYAIQQIKEVLNPARIDIREEALEIMNQKMRASDAVRIKYASKYASIANYWKKWIGENRGLEKANAIRLKQQQEKAFLDATKGHQKFDGLMDEFESRYEAIEKYAQARSYFVEIPYRKVEILSLANKFTAVIDLAKKGEELDSSRIASLKSQIETHFKDYDLETDKAVAKALIVKYAKEMPSEFNPASLKGKSEKETIEMIAKMYEKSVFVNELALMSLVENYSAKKMAKLEKDPAWKMMDEFWGIYFDQVRPKYSILSDEIDSLSKIYVAGLREFVPGKYYPDANSTLRLAYGQVDDYQPRDAVDYSFYTTTDGIIQKYDPGSADFDLPERLVELIQSKDYGQYADEEGYMPVCFTASNHTTGGNSGSPVLNGNGELIGLNFDRNWEGTMSDINYDIEQCRNISVDIRYVLFIVDKFANAGHLVEEMKLMSKK